MAPMRFATWVGAVSGALVFVGVGAVPAAVWGGFVGVLVGRALLGRPIGQGATDRLAVGAGVACGVLLTLLVFTAAGAWLGRRVSTLRHAHG